MSSIVSNLLYYFPWISNEKSSNQNGLKEKQKLCTIQSKEEWETTFCNYNLKEWENFLNVEFVHVLKNLDLSDLQKQTNIPDIKKYVLENELALTLPPINSTTKYTSSSKIVRFFNNFIENLVDALDFFDVKEPASSIYERHVGIQIYYQFFKIPYVIAGLLQPFILVAWQVYAVTLATLACVSGSIYTYLYWFRPFPTTLAFCESIEETIDREYPYPIRGLDHEAGLMITHLNQELKSHHKQTLKKCRPLMLIAETGQGKTTLVYKLHQMIKNGEVPESIKNKKIFLLKGGELMAKSSMGIGNKLKIIENKLAGHEKNVIVFIDEVQAFAENSSSLELIKGFLRNSSIQFIVATTFADFNKIKDKDPDYSFRRPFFYITFNKWDDNQLESLLTEMIYHNAQDILFESGVIDKIIELTNKHQQDQSQPTKAFKLLESVIKSCRTNFEYFQSQELEKLQMELKTLTCQRLTPNLQIKKNRTSRIKKLQSDIQDIEKDKEFNLGKANMLKNLIIIKNNFHNQLINCSNTLLDSYGKHLSANMELEKKYLYIKFYILPALDKVIGKVVEELKGKMNVVVDQSFVEEVFKGYREIEEKVIKVENM